jgi:5-methylcytosine-specific restriction enzyme A
MKFLTPCLVPGCPNLTKEGRCEEHAKPKAYKPAQKLGKATYDHRWAKLRSMHRRSEPLCRSCRKAGRVKPVEEVDHVVPFRGSAYLMLAEWNLQSLCRKCHVRKSAYEGRWADLKYPMPDRSLELLVVAGGPGVGKTTYAKATGLPVLDLGEILASMGSLGQAPSMEQIAAALAVRNQKLRAGARYVMPLVAPMRAERMFWAKVWGARVVHLLLPQDVWLERTRGDMFRGGGYDRTEAIARYQSAFDADRDGDPIERLHCG